MVVAVGFGTRASVADTARLCILGCCVCFEDSRTAWDVDLLTESAGVDSGEVGVALMYGEGIGSKKDGAGEGCWRGCGGGMWLSGGY